MMVRDWRVTTVTASVTTVAICSVLNSSSGRRVSDQIPDGQIQHLSNSSAQLLDDRAHPAHVVGIDEVADATHHEQQYQPYRRQDKHPWIFFRKAVEKTLGKPATPVLVAANMNAQNAHCNRSDKDAGISTSVHK
jgi:hypothetical protein